MTSAILGPGRSVPHDAAASARSDRLEGTITRRGLTAALALLVAAPLAVALPPTPAGAAQQRTRVIVTLDGIDRRSEVERLLDALRGYDYRVVSISKKSPTVVMDASKRAIRRIQSLPFVASVQEDVAVGIPEKPKPLPAFRVTIRESADFYAAVQQVEAALSDIEHTVREVDQGRRLIIVAMREQEMGRLSTIPGVESVVLMGARDNDPLVPIPEEIGTGIGVTPEEEARRRNARRTGGGNTTRVIVQYGAGDRKRQERRILAALEGTGYRVAKRFAVTRAIVLDVDERAMRRLRRLDGIRIQADSLSAPN